MLLPTVRYMIVCDDCQVDRRNPLRVDIRGLLVRLRSVDGNFPFRCEEFCVFLVLASGRGTGIARIVCTDEESGDRIFGSVPRKIVFGPDPLQIVSLLFRIRDGRFPRAGMYAIEFWYNDVKVDERPLAVR